VRWASERGFDLRVTAVDIHPTTLELAREHLRRHPAEAPHITVEQADARKLSQQYGARAFDYVHAGMFLHHLSNVDVMTVLSIMDRLARVGIIWNDLVRSELSLRVTQVVTLALPHIVRHDATASIRAGFTRSEVIDMAERLGLGYVRHREQFLVQRFTLAGEKPGAWADPPGR
jgi:ubiquinone/menaquinone biosynthesis C-methylase UbiE